MPERRLLCPLIAAATLATATLAAATLAATALAAQDFDVTSQIGPDPVLRDPDPPFLAGMKIAKVIGWQHGETPQVPEGLTITAYATDLVNPRTVYTLPNGDVLVVRARGPEGAPAARPKDLIRGWVMSYAHGSDGEQKDSNLITLLRDSDRDGVVDERRDVLTGLNSPFGVVWFQNTLYVAATDAILAYPYQLGQTALQARPRVLTPLPGGPINHHWTKDLALGPDGRHLYVSVGSNSNIAENGIEAEKQRAAIWQANRETGAYRVFAGGLRNPNGLTFHPESRVLCAVVNERDELGPDLVPDYLTSVQEGAFYGWPWSYFGPHVDARVYPPRPDMVERAIAPDYALSSHVAPLGLVFSNGSALPEPYADGAFIGEHGSWNRDRFNGYQVVYVPFADGRPAGMAQAVVTGFLQGDQARGRPVGLGIDGTGALLVADDAGNTVWRVAAADGTVTDQPVGTDERARAATADSDGASGEATAAPGTTKAPPPAPPPDPGTGPRPPLAPTPIPGPAPPPGPVPPGTVPQQPALQ